MSLDWFEAMQRLAAAAALGAALGLNRNAVGKPVGVKTLGLVALGAAVFTMAATDFVDVGRWDAASRVIQGVATGVGFVGAGAILRHGHSQTVEGITTATSVWVTAALGCACGMGEWRIATVATVLALAVLLLGSAIENAYHKLTGGEP